MPPDITFRLSHEAFDQFAALLSQHGVTVREDREEPVLSSPSLEYRSGILTHEGRDFCYRRQKVLGDFGMPWTATQKPAPSLRVFPDGHLSVNILRQPPDAVEQLYDILEHIFPDPPQQKDSVPPRHL